MTTVCPKCGFSGPDPEKCPQCGINFRGYARHLQHRSAAPAASSGPAPRGLEFFQTSATLYVQQSEDALRIFTGWQTCNRYSILSGERTVGFIAERSEGFAGAVCRLLLRTHRPLVVDVADENGHPVAVLSRRFFFFFSDLEVIDPQGHTIGVVSRRWGILRKIYALSGPRGVFATLRSTILGGKTLGDAVMGNDTYTAFAPGGQESRATIYRQWNGLVNRVLTDKDTFVVELDETWSSAERAVFVAASISIDLDSYESGESVAQRTGLAGAIGSMISSVLFGRRND